MSENVSNIMDIRQMNQCMQRKRTKGREIRKQMKYMGKKDLCLFCRKFFPEINNLVNTSKEYVAQQNYMHLSNTEICNR